MTTVRLAGAVLVRYSRRAHEGGLARAPGFAGSRSRTPEIATLTTDDTHRVTWLLGELRAGRPEVAEEMGCSLRHVGNLLQRLIERLGPAREGVTA